MVTLNELNNPVSFTLHQQEQEIVESALDTLPVTEAATVRLIAGYISSVIRGLTVPNKALVVGLVAVQLRGATMPLKELNL